MIEPYHTRLARVVGQMSLALVRRSVSRSLLRAWAATLRSVAEDLERTAGADGRGRG